MRNVIITGGNSGGSYASSTLEVRGPGDYSRFGLKPGIPIYQQFVEDPDRFLYVSKPQLDPSPWEHFEP